MMIIIRTYIEMGKNYAKASFSHFSVFCYLLLLKDNNSNIS